MSAQISSNKIKEAQYNPIALDEKDKDELATYATKLIMSLKSSGILNGQSSGNIFFGAYQEVGGLDTYIEIQKAVVKEDVHNKRIYHEPILRITKGGQIVVIDGDRQQTIPSPIIPLPKYLQ